MAELFGCRFKGSGGGGTGGVTSHNMLAIIRGCAAQMGGFLKKSVNMGLISTPQKDPETRVKFVENQVKTSWRKFWKIGTPT